MLPQVRRKLRALCDIPAPARKEEAGQRGMWRKMGAGPKIKCGAGHHPSASLALARPCQSPITDSMMKVANSTKWVMPSMALVSPSLRLIAATTRVIVTITVCTGVIAMMKGCPV